jgi:hypothetical protein
VILYSDIIKNMKYTPAMQRVVMTLQQYGIVNPSPNQVSLIASDIGEDLTSAQIVYISNNI